MKFYGYGYRKNCFGQRMFFEDEMLVSSYGTFRHVLSKSLSMAKRDLFFSFKVSLDTGETWAVECRDGDAEDDVFTVTFSRVWNDRDPEKKMSRKAITKWITESVKGGSNHEFQ